MYYSLLYQCVFGLAFLNFLIYWIDLFFSSSLIKLPLFHAKGNTPEIFNTKKTQLKTKNFEILEFLIGTVLWFLLTLLLFFRYIKSNHFPLANFYEALIFLTWCLVTLNFLLLFESQNLYSLIFQKIPLFSPLKKSTKIIRTKTPIPHENMSSMANSQQTKEFFSDQLLYILSRPQKKVYGGILAPSILFIIAFAQFNLSSEFTPLVPALKSNWLLMHVSIMICSYTIFIGGGLIALILLIQKFFNTFGRYDISKTTNFNNPLSLFSIKTFFFKNYSLFKLWQRKRDPSYFPPNYNNLQSIQPKKNDQLFLFDQFPGSYDARLFSLESQTTEKNNSLESSLSLYPSVIKKNEGRKSFYSSSDSFNSRLSSSMSLNNESITKYNFNLGLLQKRERITLASLDKNINSLLVDTRKNLINSNLLNHFTDNVWEHGTNKTFNRKNNENKENKDPVFSNTIVSNFYKQNTTSHPNAGGITTQMQKNYFYITLDQLSYRMFGIGFPLFTLGILSGAVWANSAWGSYWSWDIKETGSFINWLVIAFYLHCRYKNFITLSHVVAFLSLLVLFFNFFGISLGIFGSSLHAYGAAA